MGHGFAFFNNAFLLILVSSYLKFNYLAVFLIIYYLTIENKIINQGISKPALTDNDNLNVQDNGNINVLKTASNAKGNY